MIKKIVLLISSLLMLSGCNKQEEPYIEPSVLQERIDSGYFDKEYHYEPSDTPIDKSRLVIIIKHEISISSRVFSIKDFPELNIELIGWNYTITQEDYSENYRMNVGVSLKKEENDSLYIKQIKSLINNEIVYDVVFTELLWTLGETK